MNKSLLAITTALVLSSCANYKANIQTDMKPLVSGISLQNIDKSIRPQDDFYRFVNGKWLNEFQLPADKSYYGSHRILVDEIKGHIKAIINEVSTGHNQLGSPEQKIADIYKTYMDIQTLESKGISSLAKEIERIDSITNNTELSEYMGYADVFSKAPFGFYVFLDDENSNEYIIYINQSGLGLPDRDYYFKEDDKSKNIQAKYVAHIGKILTLAGMKNAEDRAKNIYALEKSLAHGHWERVKSNDTEKTYNKMSFEAFAAIVPSINLETWLRHTMIAKPEVVVVEQPSYFNTINQVIADTPLGVWKDYFKWHLISNKATSLSSVFEKEDFAFYSTVLSGTTEQEPRWKRGVDLVNRAAGELVGKVYVKKHFKPEAKTRMVNMVGILRDTYAEGIKNLAWMSAETKVNTLERLATFNIKIGYPDVWRDYSKMEINGTDLMANRKEITRFYYHRSRSKLGKPINRTLWDMNPQSVTAVSTPAKNEIIFSAGYLQAPFFNLKADDAVNYGAIGAIIAHEMGHGFDFQSLKHDDENKKNRWAEEDIKQFKKRAKKLNKQYDAFTIFDGTHVNGEFTQEENLADLIGLSIAYKAFKANYKGNAVIDGYTPEQRFFLGWAQIWMNKYRDEELLRQIKSNLHSPPEFRTNGILRNLSEFYKAFGVKPGDGMYLPEELRVRIL